MLDYKEGIKREVAEIKFLIHDLRIESFINEVIHFHVTLNTDLEIYSVSQAQVLHGQDLQELKKKAVSLRRAYHDYANAVRSFSPDKTILLLGKKYIETIHETCDLILHPLWGRIDSVLSFLPEESRSVRSRNHYRNCLRWIAGVHSRIKHFVDEQKNKDVYEEFDIAADIQDFTRNVIYGYVTEKGSARVELQLDQLDPAILGGNRYRFRRMFFNLVMNAVDAMSSKKVGVLNVSDVVEGDRVVLRVRDNGTGMHAEKIKHLLADKKTLDGELHSLGFVFVRQTITEFKGELSIESEVGKGTTVSVRLPFLRKAEPAPRTPPSEPRDLRREQDAPARREWAATRRRATPAEVDDENESACGEIVYADFRRSDAEFPGSIFAIAVDENNKIDFFTHRPYERYWNITHEDLSPMFFEATVRGRLEEDDEKRPVLILKAPQNVREYFEFRSVPDAERNSERYTGMIRDEYIRVARKLIDTGLEPHMGLHATGLEKFFPKSPELLEEEPFPLEMLAKQTLLCEEAGTDSGTVDHSESPIR